MFPREKLKVEKSRVKEVKNMSLFRLNSSQAAQK